MGFESEGSTKGSGYSTKARLVSLFSVLDFSCAHFFEINELIFGGFSSSIDWFGERRERRRLLHPGAPASKSSVSASVSLARSIPELYEERGANSLWEFGFRELRAATSDFSRLLKGQNQWLAEVHFLGVVEHPNLVKLIGYCATHSERGPQRLLVYEYMSNRALDDHLQYKHTLSSHGTSGWK